jgi:hypothetical protein
VIALKYVIRMISALLLLASILLLCACGQVSVTDSQPTESFAAGSDVVPEETFAVVIDVVTEQAKLLGLPLKRIFHYTVTLHEGCKETMNLLFFQSTEAEEPEYWGQLCPGLYVFDLDTGIWYQDSERENMNTDTRESAVRWVLSAFVDNPIDILIQEDVVLLSSEEKITFIDQETLADINQSILLDQFAHQPIRYPYTCVDDEPRKLSDDQLRTLRGYPHGVLKSTISTIPDAIAYMDMMYPYLWMGMAVSNEFDVQTRWLRSAQEILYFSYEAPAARSCVVNCLTYLLDDDYEIESLIAFWHDEEFCEDPGPEKAINFIKTTDGFLFFDPVLRMQGDHVSRYGDLLPEMTCGSVAEYSEHIRKDSNLAPIIDYIFRVKGGARLDYYYWTFGQRLVIESDSEGVEMVYLGNQGQLDTPAFPENPMIDLPEEIWKEKDPAKLRQMISTMEEAVAYLDARYPDIWQGMSIHNGDESIQWLRSAEEVLKGSVTAFAGRSDIYNVITYLLSDDMEIFTILGFWHDENGSGPHKAINCIKTESGYQFVDPVLRMNGNQNSIFGGILFPETTTATLEEYIAFVQSSSQMAEFYDAIWLIPNGIRIDYGVELSGWANINTNDAQLLYINEANHEPEDVYWERLYGHIKPENIGSYKLAYMLGGTTLTPEEAYGLVGAEPEVVRDKVKTAADVLMYMLAAQIGDCNGCKCTDIGKYTWHWNISAKDVMEMKVGNCGSCANLANYLLDGDYEEVGFIDHTYYPGNGGAHVYTYILYEGKYYIVDYSWYIFEFYDILRDHPVPVLDNLEQWPDYAPSIYGPLNLIMAYDTPGMQYPVLFSENYMADFNNNYYYILPEGVEYQILFEDPSGYEYYHIPFDKSAYDWTVFW